MHCTFKVEPHTFTLKRTLRCILYIWEIPKRKGVFWDSFPNSYCTVYFSNTFPALLHRTRPFCWKWSPHGTVVRFFTLSFCLLGPSLETTRTPLSPILSTEQGYWGWLKIQDVTVELWRNTGEQLDKCLDYTSSSRPSVIYAPPCTEMKCMTIKPKISGIEFLSAAISSLLEDTSDSWDLFHLIDGAFLIKKFPPPKRSKCFHV